MRQDPGTYTGAALNDLDYPARWGELPVIYALAGDKWPKPFDTATRTQRKHTTTRASDEELVAASARMNPLFQGLYPKEEPTTEQ